MKNKITKNVTLDNSAPAAAVAVEKLAEQVTKRDEHGLTPQEAAVAAELQGKCPQIVEAVTAVSEFEMGLRDKYFRLCEAIRETQLPVAAGATRTLNRREVTLLLLSLGYTKQRITEINRVVEVTPELWEQFKKRAVGFRAVLTLARAKDKESAKAQAAEADQLTDSTAEGNDPGVAPKPAEPTPKMPVALEDALVGVIVEKQGFGKLKLTKDAGYVFEVHAHSKKFTVTLFVDKA